MGAQTGHQPSEEPRNGGEIGSEVHRIGRNDERLRVVRVAVAEPPEDLEFRADRLQLQLQFATLVGENRLGRVLFAMAHLLGQIVPCQW